MTLREGRAQSLPAEWRVQLPIFEGPLDLLLHLIRINEVDIKDIPVAIICDQFHAYLELLEELNLDIAAEFIYEAAVLIQLKSRMLLPRPEKEKGEEGGGAEDPRTPLVRRLLEYRRLRQAAASLAEVDQVRSGIFTRTKPFAFDATPSLESELVPASDEVSLFDLVSALRRVFERYRQEHPEPLEVPVEEFSVRSEMEAYLARLEPGQAIELLQDLASRSCRLEAVAAFLAVLEMVRLGLLALERQNGMLFLWRTSRSIALGELEEIAG